MKINVYNNVLLFDFYVTNYSVYNNKQQMKKELIQELFLQLEGVKYEEQLIEYWSARDLQLILGYNKWENFMKVIGKAKESCENSGVGLSDHFVDINKVVPLGKGGQRILEDIALTRYACYLIAQNGESSKSQIAFAQTYFAVQTRKQEIIEKRLYDVARLNARARLTRSEKKLSGILYERGVDDKGFTLIRSRGDEILFGGYTTQMMKEKMGVPANEPLADFLPNISIKAKDFAIELTSHNVEVKDLRGVNPIKCEHEDNNKAVRNLLLKRGVKPELLEPDQDISIVKRRINGDDKKFLDGVKKISAK